MARLAARVALSAAAAVAPASRRALAARAAPAFNYTELFPTAGPKETPYRKITGDFVSTFDVQGERLLKVRPPGGRVRGQRACPASLARLAAPY